jgi:hypothetical protein
MLDLAVLNLEVPPRVSLAARQLVAAREPLDPPDIDATIHDTLVRKCAAGDIAQSRIHLPLPSFTARSSQKAKGVAVPNCSGANDARQHGQR